MSKNSMNNINNSFDELKKEYNIDELYVKGHPVKGKHAKHFKKVAIFLDDDLVDKFPDSKSVNKALRSVVSH